jgi:enamine deaminase RidA (YjgF/YER057c/UK114 family)
MSVDDRLQELGIVLGDPLPPVGHYIGAVTVGNLVFLSGHGPRETDGPVEGKVGETLTLEQGQQAARNAGLNMLATLKAVIENLDRVRRVVKVLGMVNAVPDFREHPKVINGFSDLMVEVFGDAGRGGRSAVGTGSLPFQIPVEVEMIVEIE